MELEYIDFVTNISASYTHLINDLLQNGWRLLGASDRFETDGLLIDKSRPNLTNEGLFLTLGTTKSNAINTWERHKDGYSSGFLHFDERSFK